MRIVILGGAGDMGSETARDITKYSGADEIVIADRNTEAANRLVQELNDSRVKSEKVDATSHEDLVRVMKNSTVVAGALGPFYLFEKSIVEAAIDAGTNYVSICDDHDAAEAVLALDDLACKKECRILTGLGWTPGLSNMLARKGFNELDITDRINVYWAGSAGDSEGMAVILHTMHIFTGKVTSYQDGNFIEIKAGSGKETIEFPLPLGFVNTFHVGHPEPVTLPRYLEGIHEVTLKGGLAENYLNGLAKFVSAAGLTRTPTSKQKLGRLLKTLMPLFPTDQNRSFSGIRVDISGQLNSKPAVISYSAIDHMNKLTAIPLSIGTIMMASDKIQRFGVYGPEAEGAVNPDSFFGEIGRRGIKIFRETY